MEINHITVRPLTADDWAEFRRVRLSALEMHPGNFLSPYATEVAQPPERWQELLGNSEGCIFGVFDVQALIGIGGVWLHEGNGASFHQMFIEPGYRGQKLSRLLYEARIDWAKEKGVKAIHVSHREGNDASKYANQHFGFKLFSQEEIEWPDGKRAVDNVYRLEL